MKGIVIVADGDENDRASISKLLSNEGYKITQISDGMKCLKVIDGKSWRWVPKIILIDSLIGGISAFELLRRLSDKYAEKDTILIMTSKYKSPEDEVEAFNAGAAGYLIKPITKEDIYSIKKRLEEKSSRLATEIS